MKEIYLERHPEDIETAEDMFVLGILHDMGYEVEANPEGHAKRGGELLKRQGYIYWREVYHHGDVYAAYSSEALDLLNFCDMSVNSNGEDVGTKDRLLEIFHRYGENSYQYKNAKIIIERICDELQ